MADKVQIIKPVIGGQDREVIDSEFLIRNATDLTKVMDFDVSGVTTGETRTLKMADEDIDLATDFRKADASVVDVRTAADLPTPGSTYPLVANTTYKFYGTVSIGTIPLDVGNGNIVLEGFDSENSKINYTGTFSAVIGINCSGRIQSLTIDAPNSATFCIGIEDTVAGVNSYVFKDCNFDGCLVGISVKDLKRASIEGCSFVDMASKGVLVQGTLNEDITVRDSLFDGCVDSGIDMTLTSAVVDIMTIRDNSFDSPAGSIAISGDAANANINIFGRILDCIFTGDGAALGGITSEDSRWWVQTSLGEDISPSAVIGSYSISANAINTPITNGAFEDVVGVGVANVLNERATVSDAANVTTLTMLNLISAKGSFVTTFTVSQTGGGVRSYAITYSKNTVDASDEFTVSITSDPQTYTLTFPIEFTDGDDFKLRAEGIGTANDVLFSEVNTTIQ